jgi:hypothetical protein
MRRCGRGESGPSELRVPIHHRRDERKDQGCRALRRSFALDDIPLGTYPLEAWHATLGTVTPSVTVDPKGVAEVMLEMTKR